MADALAGERWRGGHTFQFGTCSCEFAAGSTTGWWQGRQQSAASRRLGQVRPYRAIWLYDYHRFARAGCARPYHRAAGVFFTGTDTHRHGVGVIYA